jgi:hypothetical protein
MTFWARAVREVARRPRLWGVAIRQMWRMVPDGWWREPPFLPRPDPAYVAFRLETQYGDAAPEPLDVVRYLEWCRARERELREHTGRRQARR